MIGKLSRFFISFRIGVSLSVLFLGIPESNDSGATFPNTVEVFIQQAKLTATDNEAFDVFGSSIAVNGDTVVVGASLDDIDGNEDQGSVYVFVKSGWFWNTQTQTAKLTASDGEALDWFGYAVAIVGDTIVVGTPGGPTGEPSTIPGSIYIFEKPVGGWVDMTQTAKLTASDGEADDRLGISVSINGDTVIAGSFLDDVNSNTNQGSVYVFTRPIGGWEDMTQTAKLTASDGEEEMRFGISVSISGNTILSGAAGSTSSIGSTYIFIKPTGDWVDATQNAILTASDGQKGDLFGSSVTIFEDTVIVGAYGDTIEGNDQQGSAYVFIKPTGGWIDATQIAKLTASDSEAVDWLGWSVALGGDTIVVGAPWKKVGADDDQGSAYVFVKPDEGWEDMTQTEVLTANDGEAGDALGWSVAIDEGTIVAGAYSDSFDDKKEQGSVYVYNSDNPIRFYYPIVGR